MKLLTLSFQLEGFLPHPTTGIVVYLPLRSIFRMFLTAVFSFAFMSFISPFFAAKNCALSCARHLFHG